jgi:hypothetical protein
MSDQADEHDDGSAKAKQRTQSGTPGIDDLEVDDIDEDSFEGDDGVAFWSERQKELVTAQVDYNLGTLRDLASDNTIDMKPHFQRRYRWDSAKKSKLIESLLLNVPIPPIYLNEDRYGKYSIIDGKQRISAVYDFLQGGTISLWTKDIFRAKWVKNFATTAANTNDI